MSDNAIRFVVTPVHGTYAKGAPWTQDKSKLEQALTQRFGASVLWRPCEWSGHNNPAARAEGRDLLRAHLSDLLGTYKEATHYIIAHSHGGNVALYALQDKVLRDSIAGVACLATPFILSRPRVLGSKSVTAHVAVVVALLLLVMQFLARWWLSSFQPAWLRELMIYVFLLLSMGVLVPLLKNWWTFAERLHQELWLPKLSEDRLLIIRAPGDEASAALLFFQFISEISVRLYVFLNQFYEKCRGVLKRWSKHPFLMVVALVSGFIPYVLFIICAIALKMPAWAALVVMMLLGWLCIAVPALTLFKKIDIAVGPMQFAIGAFLLAIIMLLSMTLLPFGWQVALSNIYFDVTAETTPPGTWEVNQIEPSRSQDQASDVLPLEHSVVYEDESALTLICDWMERTETRSHASG